MVSNPMLTLLFLAVVLAVYYLVPVRARWGVLLAASLIFYMSVNPWMVLLAGGSALWSWFAGSRIGESKHKRTKRGWLLAGILPLLGILFLFKYFNFFLSSILGLFAVFGFSGDAFVLRLLLPLGISYYTFKLISYLADLCLEKRKPETHVGYYLTYVLFFPQIVSGPIARSEDFLPQIREGLVFEKTLFLEGLCRILLGLFKKMVIANRLSAYVDVIFGAPESYPALAALMAAVFYSFQLYCDFSGYSDLAIGMGNLLGIHSKKNFDCPYFARNIKEFWSRWHISLSGWLRDYVYIPLGGSRVSPMRRNVNLLATFLVSGLWHGASWTFVFWGGLHGLWEVCSTIWQRKIKRPRSGGRAKHPKVLRTIWQTLITFLGVTLGWIFFRAESIGAAFAFLKHMVLDFSLSFLDIQNSILPFTGDNTCAAYFLTVCLFLLLLFVYEWQQVYGKGQGIAEGSGGNDGQMPLSVTWIAVMLASLLLFGIFGASGFLYANF